MVIAIDFDGTLCEHKFPDIGPPIPEMISYVKAMKKQGHTIVLWTCRENTEERNWLLEAVAWCNNQGVAPDYVNEYPHPLFSHHTVDGKRIMSRKIMADLYIDDKAVNVNVIRQMEQLKYRW